MAHTDKLLDEYPLIILPSIAVVVGLNEAIILQQIHYWIQHNSKSSHADLTFRLGHQWTYNTLKAWMDQFPFWSLNTIRRAITSLENAGIVVSAQLADDPRDRTVWYRIDYTVLDRVTNRPDPGMSKPCAQNEHMGNDVPKMGTPCAQNGHMDVPKMSICLRTETTPETTPEREQNPSDSVAVEKPVSAPYAFVETIYKALGEPCLAIPMECAAAKKIIAAGYGVADVTPVFLQWASRRNFAVSLTAFAKDLPVLMAKARISHTRRIYDDQREQSSRLGYKDNATD